MEDESEKYIAITHFINPHQFWYTCIHDDDNYVVRDLEDALNKRYMNNYSGTTRQFTPVIGALVAVEYMTNKKQFIRARIEEKFSKPYTKSTSYIVWAIDHGFPFETSEEHIRYLPDELSKPIDYVRCGGIANLVPAEEDFDFINYCKKLEVKKKWNNNACDTLEKILLDAASIGFLERLQSKDGHCWGDLRIVNHRGKSMYASKYLINEKFGVMDAGKFVDFCIKSHATQLPVWQSNNGNDKYSKNKVPTMVYLPDVDKKTCLPDPDELQSANLKVAAWSTHNRNATNYTSSASIRNEGSVVSSNLYDTDLDDSVSKTGSIDKEFTNRGIHKKHKKSVPPQPTLHDFGITEDISKTHIDDNSSISADISSVSEQKSSTNKHTKYLMELRKKSLFKLKEESAKEESLQHMDNVSAVSDSANNLDTPSKISLESEIECDLKSLRKLKLVESKAETIKDKNSVISNGNEPSFDRTTFLKSLQTDPDSTKKIDAIPVDSSRNSRTELSARKSFLKFLQTECADSTVEKPDSNSAMRLRNSEAENLNNRVKRLENANQNEDNAFKAKVPENPTSDVKNNNSAQSDDDIRSITLKRYLKLSHIKNAQSKNSERSETASVVSSITSRSETRNKRLEHVGNMIPAGFDLANLNTYRDKNHWHRKNTTRQEQSGARFKHSFEDENQDQDFRFTRVNTDKYKNCNNDMNKKETQVSNSKKDTENITQTVPKPPTEQTDGIPKKNERSPKILLPTNTDRQYHSKTENNNISSNSSKSILPMQLESCQKVGSNYSPLLDQQNEFDLKTKTKATPSEPDDIFQNVTKKKSSLNNKENHSDFLNISKSTFSSMLDSNQNSDNESRYSSALSCFDEDSQEENCLETSTLSLYKSIKEYTISPPDITERKITNKQNDRKNPPNSSQKFEENVTQLKNTDPNILEKQQEQKIKAHEKITIRPKYTEPNTLEKQQEQITIPHEEKAIRLKYTEHLALAHSQIQLYTAEKLEDVFLASEVIDEMKRIFINKVFRIQSYAWSHMMCGNGLFIVNAAKTGKTWSYIPSLCSFITYNIKNSEIPSTYGPMAIVLVPSANHAIEVGNSCSRLLSKLNREDTKTVISYGIQNLTKVKVKLIEACAILVSTPSSLLRLMEDNENKDPLFDPTRIQQIIIDNVDVLLSRAAEDFSAVFKKLYALVPKINKSKKMVPQLIVTSCLYQPIFKKLIPISNQPLLLIGDFLEAAVYGKANILIKLCPKQEKIPLILNFIKNHPIVYEPLIILCNCEEDVLFIVDKLISHEIPSIGFHTRSPAIALQQVEDWKAQVYPMKVLVCSDDAFPELNVQCAQNLIHYSLAKSWTKFTFRFISLLKIYDNLVVKGFNGPPPEKRATSLILLDEENNTELPRLIEFLKTHNQIDRVQSDVLELSKRIQLQREMKRCSENTQLCSSLFEFGECDNARCENRHVLALADVKKEKNESFQNGDLRLLVLNVFSPTHFSARLLEHRPMNSSNWRAVRQSEKAGIFAMKFNSFYCLDSDNLKLHWPVKVNDLCVCKKDDTFYRARVLSVPDAISTYVIQSLPIKLKLIDTGAIFSTQSDEVYFCHERFRDFPPQAVDVHLIGVLPFDNERMWDSVATKHVNLLIKENLAENQCVHVNIDFALDDAIWVNNVFIMERLPTLRSNAFVLNVKRHLINGKWGILDKNIVTKIHNIIEEQGFGYIFEKVTSLDDTNKQTDNSVQQNENTQTDNSVQQNEKKQQPEEMQPKQKIHSPIKPNLETLNRNSMSKNFTASFSDKDNSDVEVESSIISKQQRSGVETPSAKPNKSTADSTKKISKTESLTSPSCTIQDFLECLEKDLEINAEELEEKNNNEAENLRQLVRDTKEIRKMILSGKEKNENVKKSQKSPKDLPSSDVPTLCNLPQDSKQQTSNDLPTLHNLHRRPKTLWYETTHLIILSILAPDIDEYHLKVTRSSLAFAAYVDGVQTVLVLNFLGTVEPSLVAHEIRGLYVVVRLVKTLFVKWPRLLKQTMKLPYLTYNLNRISDKELLDFSPKILTTKPSYYSDDDSFESEDNEYDHYKTFNPIFNKEDIHDPIGSD